jgi:Ser-tRNA(Ala) deacylase AlaX
MRNECDYEYKKTSKQDQATEFKNSLDELVALKPGTWAQAKKIVEQHGLKSGDIMRVAADLSTKGLGFEKSKYTLAKCNNGSCEENVPTQKKETVVSNEQLKASGMGVATDDCKVKQEDIKQFSAEATIGKNLKGAKLSARIGEWSAAAGYQQLSDINTEKNSTIDIHLPVGTVQVDINEKASYKLTQKHVNLLKNIFFNKKLNNWCVGLDVGGQYKVVDLEQARLMLNNQNMTTCKNCSETIKAAMAVAHLYGRNGNLSGGIKAGLSKAIQEFSINANYYLGNGWSAGVEAGTTHAQENQTSIKENKAMLVAKKELQGNWAASLGVGYQQTNIQGPGINTKVNTPVAKVSVNKQEEAAMDAVSPARLELTY